MHTRLASLQTLCPLRFQTAVPLFPASNLVVRILVGRVVRMHLLSAGPVQGEPFEGLLLRRQLLAALDGLHLAHERLGFGRRGVALAVMPPLPRLRLEQRLRGLRLGLTGSIRRRGEWGFGVEGWKLRIRAVIESMVES